MDINYAIYAYRFVQENDGGDWTQDEQVKEVNMSNAQNLLYELFGKTNTVFRVFDRDGDGAKEYDCKVYGNDHRIVALRLLNCKEISYSQVVPDPLDSMGAVKKKSLISTPDTYVIIDCRPGHNLLAVKVDKEAWRNTDTVRDLMETSINNYLKSLSRGFRVQLYTKMISREFYNYSRNRIKKEGRGVKSLTIRFKTGKLNSQVEAIVKGSDYLKRLFSMINKYGGASGEMTLNYPIGPKLIDRRRHDIENIILLIESDPIGYALDMTFDDDVTLHCGKDTRAELPIVPVGALELFHLERKVEKVIQTDLFETNKNLDEGKYYLEMWLDNMAEETKKMKDAETIKRKRSRSNKRKAS